MGRIDILPKYTVKVEGGSGCLFQPINDEYSYVLTAKHVVSGNNAPSIIRQYIDNNEVLVNEKLEIIGEPFRHSDDNKDAAIIKVKKIADIESILRADLSSENKEGYYLCGHPNSRANNAYSWRENKVSIGNKKQYGYREAELSRVATRSEIVGQSGGGIIKIEETCFLLAGIQKQMTVADAQEQLGRIDFMPLSFFDEIIDDNENDLSELFPPYIGSFERLINDIFPLVGIQVTEQRKKLIQNELKVIAKSLCEDFSPQKIVEIYKDSFLVSGTDKGVINHKQLWISFLELLSINQLHCEQKITFDELKLIHKSKKLYFTDSKEWISKLEDIYRSDLSEVEKGGLVVVGATIDVKPTVVQLDKGYIGDICTVPSKEMNISNTVTDPFKDLTIVHIFKFQKHVIENYREFAEITAANSFQKIKDVTNGVI